MTFQRVRALHPPRSFFDLSYQKLMDITLGKLYPVMCDEVIPGDFFKIGNEMVLRFQPMVAPILNEVYVTVHYFFVPYRLLWNAETNEELEETGSWEDYITGGFDGDDASVLPTWSPTIPGGCAIGSLWDYLGFPTALADYTSALPCDFPRRAYNLIINDYYIDSHIDPMLGLDNENIARRRWNKDYFTSARLNQQLGTAPALPISGSTHALWDASSFVSVVGPLTPNMASYSPSGRIELYPGGSSDATNLLNVFNDNTVDLSVASTFDIADLRLAFQIQKWLERNQRAGARYKEFLLAHYGQSPRDDRLQRPEYIGGSKSPVIFSEVLQTSESGSTAQGNLAGHGISVSRTFCGKYHVKEHGLIMGLLSVMPKAIYQQGINRQWLKDTRYDFYFPEFANLSEQAILKRELFVTAGDAGVTNLSIFGYQGRYDEHRQKMSMVCGKMRDTPYYSWHMSRIFTTAPTLNSAFIGCTPRLDCMAAPQENPILLNFGNIIHAMRPLPVLAEPGLIDHM